MQAFGFQHYGPPTVLEELTLVAPEIKANQVLLTTLGFGLNPYDIALRAGEHQGDRSLTFPFIPGSDAVGIVSRIGQDVSPDLLGQTVIAHAFSGAYAEKIAISAKKIMIKPDKMSLPEAASFGTIATIAYHAMITTAKIQAGETIIILGASGSVGSLAAQIAKAKGLTVIGIGNSRNRKMMNGLGIDEVVAYDLEAVGQLLAKRGDIVFDASLQGKASQQGLELLKEGGRYLYLNKAPLQESTSTAILLEMTYGKDLPAFHYLHDLYEANQLILPAVAALPATLSNLIDGHATLLTKKERGKLVYLYDTAMEVGH